MEPCTPTPVPRQSNDSASSADAEEAIRSGRFDLKSCDDKRQLLLDAWPRVAAFLQKVGLDA